MNCKQIHDQLDDFIDGKLSQQQATEIREHIVDCSVCDQRLCEHQEYIQSMGEMPVPDMSLGFTQRALRRAVEQKQHQRLGFTRGFGSALVVGLAMWAMVTVFIPGNQQMQGELANVSLALHQESTVNLVFYSPNAVANAKLSISVPEHVEIVGFGGQRTIAWETSLQQGKNILSLPLKAHAVVSAELMASIESGENKKVFRLVIDVASAKQTEVLKPIGKA